MAIEKEEKGQVLYAVSKPYDFNGNSGTSHKIRVFAGGEIFNCNSSESQVALYKEHVGKSGVVNLRFASPKESLTVEILNFKPEK